MSTNTTNTTNTTNKPGVIDTPDGIARYRLCALKGMLKLEIAGMKHSSGRSAYATIKKLYGLTGKREAVLVHMERIIKGELPMPAERPQFRLL